MKKVILSALSLVFASTLMLSAATQTQTKQKAECPKTECKAEKKAECKKTECKADKKAECKKAECPKADKKK